MTGKMTGKMTGRAPPDYFRAVERAFVELRGGMFLAPADWALVRRWEEEGVPLDVVREGIRTALGGPVRGSRRISLRDCAPAVAAAFRALGGRRGGAPPEDPSPGDGPGDGMTAPFPRRSDPD